MLVGARGPQEAVRCCLSSDTSCGIACIVQYLLRRLADANVRSGCSQSCILRSLRRLSIHPTGQAEGPSAHLSTKGPCTARPPAPEIPPASLLLISCDRKQPPLPSSTTQRTHHTLAREPISTSTNIIIASKATSLHHSPRARHRHFTSTVASTRTTSPTFTRIDSPKRSTSRSTHHPRFNNLTTHPHYISVNHVVQNEPVPRYDHG
jgi:hypothetical protein